MMINSATNPTDFPSDDILQKALEVIIKQRCDYKDLCGDILATLLLPQNQYNIPENLKQLVIRWDERFKGINRITDGEADISALK